MPVQRSLRLEKLKLDYGSEQSDAQEIKKAMSAMSMEIRSLSAEVKTIASEISKPMNSPMPFTRLDAVQSQTILQLQAERSY